MSGVPGDATEVNRAYYDQLYRHRHPLLTLMHGRISFDQQSKTQPNLQIIRPYLRKHKDGRIRVLDFGSGWGTFLLGLPDGRVDAYCFDISEGAMRGLESTMQLLGRTVARIEFDGARITPGDFDLIACSHVLEHVPSDAELLAAFAGALSPGALLLINVPINEVWADPKHVRTYDLDIATTRLDEAGFDVVEHRTLDRWTSLLLGAEAAGTWPRAFIRALRAGLVMAPQALVDLGDSMLAKNHEPQQLIVVARRR